VKRRDESRHLQAKEFKYLRVLFTRERKMERDRQPDRWSSETGPDRLGEEELSQKEKLSVYWSVYIQNLTEGHELWVRTERMRSRIQVANMSFLCRSLRDRVRR